MIFIQWPFSYLSHSVVILHTTHHGRTLSHSFTFEPITAPPSLPSKKASLHPSSLNHFKPPSPSRQIQEGGQLSALLIAALFASLSTSSPSTSSAFLFIPAAEFAPPLCFAIAILLATSCPTRPLAATPNPPVRLPMALRSPTTLTERSMRMFSGPTSSPSW